MFSQRKNLNGRKVYSEADMQLLFRIKYLLYERKFTLQGAKRRVWEEIKNVNPDLKSQIASIRSQLVGIKEIIGRREDYFLEQSPLIRQLKDLKQEALFKDWESRPGEFKERLINSINLIKPEQLKMLQRLLKTVSAPERPQLAPLDCEHWDKIKDDKIAFQKGTDFLASGKVACLTVAGGQGSRLGLDGPKGKFPVTPLRGASLFQIFAEKILAISRKYNVLIPWYIMTSPMNHQETSDFFHEQKYFGLDKRQVTFFPQGTLPALDDQGNLILSPDGGIFMNPDGHGGVVQAMAEHGIFKNLRERNIRELFYFQIDNPLVNILDPVFLGLHLSRNAQVSTKVIKKRSPEEKLGIIALVNGKPGIVEYSDLDETHMYACTPAGELLYSYGSISIYFFNVDFLSHSSLDLPYHQARKKIKALTYLHGEAEILDIQGTKFEKFIFDTIPRAEKALFVETLRDDEFTALKNKTGPDSLETCQTDLQESDARLLESCGVTVPRQSNGKPVYLIEISSLYAADREALKVRLAKDAVYQISKDTLLL